MTDIHNGRRSLTKKGPEAVRLLEQFAEFVEVESPDLVVELGDRVTDTDPDADRAALEGVADVFAAMGARRVHVMGNHDLVNLSIADNEDCLGQSFASHSVDAKGWHLVFWQADVHMSLDHAPRLTDADLAWLESDLAATDLPTIVFTHVPLDGASMTGNYYFQANPQFGGYGNVDRAQKVISEAGVVALCVAGHVHWNNISRIDGIPYLSLQSLTESYTTQDQAASSWATLTLDERLHWRGHGADPIKLTVNLGAVDRQWTAPLPPFTDLAAHRRNRAQ
ncbi:MAG: metallophosphoesterase-domain-containing protein [Actinomycetia bacterium]|nr:metallophosphoesterase-domain-containing protein [Actinomycetes bacterium]